MRRLPAPRSDCVWRLCCVLSVAPLMESYVLLGSRLARVTCASAFGERMPCTSSAATNSRNTHLYPPLNITPLRREITARGSFLTTWVFHSRHCFPTGSCLWYAMAASSAQGRSRLTCGGGADVRRDGRWSRRRQIGCERRQEAQTRHRHMGQAEYARSGVEHTTLIDGTAG